MSRPIEIDGIVTTLPDGRFCITGLHAARYIPEKHPLWDWLKNNCEQPPNIDVWILPQ